MTWLIITIAFVLYFFWLFNALMTAPISEEEADSELGIVNFDEAEHDKNLLTRVKPEQKDENN